MKPEEIIIGGQPYFPCMCCVLGWKGVVKGIVDKFCGTVDTTKCPIAKKFLRRQR